MLPPMAGKGAFRDHLAKVPLFSGLNSRELGRIAKASDEVTIKAGTVLVEQGQTGHECFIVVDGNATVRRNGRKVATVGPGAVIGELSLLDRGPRTATVTAETDMKVLVLDQRHFSGILNEVPALSQKLLTALAGRIRDLDRTAFG